MILSNHAKIIENPRIPPSPFHHGIRNAIWDLFGNVKSFMKNMKEYKEAGSKKNDDKQF